MQASFACIEHCQAYAAGSRGWEGASANSGITAARRWADNINFSCRLEFDVWYGSLYVQEAQQQAEADAAAVREELAQRALEAVAGVRCTAAASATLLLACSAHTEPVSQTAIFWF